MTLLSRTAAGLTNLDTKWYGMPLSTRQAILTLSGLTATVATLFGIGISISQPSETKPAVRSAARTTTGTTNDFFASEDGRIEGDKTAQVVAERFLKKEGLKGTAIRATGEFDPKDGSVAVTLYAVGKTGLVTNNFLKLSFPKDKIQNPDIGAQNATNCEVGPVLDKAIIRSQVGPENYDTVIAKINRIRLKAESGYSAPKLNRNFTP